MSGRTIRTGEQYHESPITKNIYRVTRWEELGNGRIKALEKEKMSFVVYEDDEDEPGFTADEWTATRHKAVGAAAILERETGATYNVVPTDWLEPVEEAQPQ